MSRLKTDAIRNVNASVDGITLDTSGNVAIPNKIGINTTSPEDLLHIKTGKIRIENAIVSNNDSTISYDNDTFLVDVDPNNVRGSSQFHIKIDTVSGLIIDDNRHATFGGRIKINDFIETSVNNSNLKLNSAGSSGQIKFHINGSEKAKFDSSGNFQINNDSGKITVGLGADLQLFHDGGTSTIRNVNNNANLELQASSTGTKSIRCYPNAGVVLYWNGETNLYTAEDAVRMNDNVKLEFGNASDLEIFHDGGDSYVRNAGVGALSLESSSYVDVRHTSAGTDPILRMVNEANTTAGAVNVIRSVHDLRTCAEIRLGRNGDNSDFSAAAGATQGDIQFWTTQGGSLSRKGTFINSGGLCFGTDTAAANALDEYEEGTWTPANQYLTITNNNTATYTKVGRLVTIQFDCTYASSPADTAQVGGRIEGLPFSAQANGFHFTPSFTNTSGNAQDNESLNFLSYVEGNSDKIKFYSIVNNCEALRAQTAGYRVRGTVTYMV